MALSIKIIDKIKICLKIENFFGICNEGKYSFGCRAASINNKKWFFNLNHSYGEWHVRIQTGNSKVEDHEEGFNIKIYRTDGSTLLNENAIIKSFVADEDQDYEFQCYQNPTPLTKEDLLLSSDPTKTDGSLRVFITYIPVIRRPNDNLTAGNELTLRSRDVASQTASLEAFGTLSKDFKELLSSARHTDVKIKVGDKEFQAHKLVLAARSQVLDSMFSQTMLENISGVVNISDCDADSFDSFLTFLYSGQLDEIPSSNIVSLYNIADKYDLPELMKECVKRLIVELSVDSACDALRLVALHEEKELMELARNFFIENAEEILDNPKWEKFQMDHLKLGNELIKCYIRKTKETKEHI